MKKAANRVGRPENLIPNRPGMQPPRNPAKAARRRFGRKQFKRILDLVLLNDIDALAEIAYGEGDDVSAFTRGMAKAMYDACVQGDWKVLEGIVDRVVGKATINMDHTSKGDKLPAPAATERVVLYMPKNGRTAAEMEAKHVVDAPTATEKPKKKKKDTRGDDGFDFGF